MGLEDLAGLVAGAADAGGSSSKRRSPLVTIIALIAVLLLGGGGGLTALLGGGGQGELTTIPGSQTGQTFNGQTGSNNAGTLDTTVSPRARAKRTVLKGNGSDSTTILVYMCGTDLESNGGFATKDLQEMAAAKLNEHVQLLVFTGGCKGWKNSVVSANKNQIYQVREGGLALLWESDRLQPMTDPTTLSSFIRWGVKNCPADRYALIFWDHGGGSVSGYGYDEAYPQTGSMTLDGIATALHDGDCTFDFIGFDACLMATLETALVVEPYADYLIASEETEPGCGWYYTNWLTALSQSPSLPALEIGRHIADDFISVCAQVARNQQATLSVLDLAELSGTVPDAFQRFAQATNASIQDDDYHSIATARGRTKEFAQSNNIDQIDLIHLANNVNSKESRVLADVLRSAVKYNATSSNIQNANGVSIYFPYGRTSSVNTASNIYDKIGLDPSYTDCIKSFASLEVAGQSVAGGNAAQLTSLFNALIGSGAPTSSSVAGADAIGQFLGSLVSGRSMPGVGLEGDQGDFLDAGLIEESAAYLAQNQFDPSTLVWTQKDGQQVLDLSNEQWDLIQTAELNVFVDDGQGYIDLGLDNVLDYNDDGDLLGQYDQTWLSVDGQIVAYYLLESTGDPDDYKIIGRIPALLNGWRVELMVAFTDEVPDGEILGAAPRYDESTQTATVYRGLVELQEGDLIDFICSYYDYERNYQDDYLLGQPLTVSGPLELGNIRMDNQDYIATYRLTDIYHNHYWTPAI